MAFGSMNTDLWRWADPDGQQRKVRFDELRAALAAGVIAPNTPVWRSGWAAWQPAHEVPELTSASVGGANGVVLNIPPPPLAMLAVQQEYEAAAGALAPAAPKAPAEDEPPPPPRYVPVPTKTPSIHPSSGQLKTQIGGSAHVPVAPGSSPGGVPAAAGSWPTLAPSTSARVPPCTCPPANPTASPTSPNRSPSW